jgi:hypothetical protein
VNPFPLRCARSRTLHTRSTARIEYVVAGFGAAASSIK